MWYLTFTFANKEGRKESEEMERGRGSDRQDGQNRTGDRGP